MENAASPTETGEQDASSAMRKGSENTFELHELQIAVYSASTSYINMEKQQKPR